MTVESFIPTSPEQVVEFVNDKENDIDQMWVYSHREYLGSLLPKIKRLNLSCDLEHQLTMTLYTQNEQASSAFDIVFNENTIVINNLMDYEFYYI
jgi:hypothetical protein